MNGEVVPMNNGDAIKSVGLTDKQRNWATELMVRVQQGQMGAADLNKAVLDLGNMRKQDEEGFLDAISTSLLVNPDFNQKGESADNLMKFWAIGAKWHEIKHKKTRTEAEVTKMSIDVLNKLRNYKKAGDGRNFGDKRYTKIIECESKPEIIGSPNTDD